MTDQGPVTVGELAHSRSGDKGNRVNIGVIATNAAAYDRVTEQLTANRVAGYFEGLIMSEVRRYELPNIQG